MDRGTDPSRGRRLEARLLQRDTAPPVQPVAPVAEADAAKDKALIDAFSAAIAAALGEEEA